MSDLPPETGATGDLGGRAIKGAAWMLAIRWTLRAMGLASTAIVARLLTPADFGIMAVAMVVYTLINVLRQSGISAALTRLPTITKDHYDTAWTIEIGLGASVALLVALAAPLAAAQFNTPEITHILWCMAAIALLAGFANTGMIEYRRDIHMQPHFLWQALGRLTGVITTIIAAFILQTYWALVIGMMAQAIANLTLSYVLHPMRPKPSLKAAGDISSFSFWSVVQAISGVLSQRLDQLLLAGNIATSRLGQYSMASNLGDMISRELTSPLTPIALSAYSKVQTDLTRLRRGVLRGVGLACVLGYPAGIGAALLAPDLVFVVLGDQWAPAADLFRILALLILDHAVRSMVVPLLKTQNRMALLTVLTWIEVALLAAMMIAFIREDSFLMLLNIAAGRLGIGILFSIILASVALRPYPGLGSDVLKQIARPLAAALIMAVCVGGSLALMDLSPIVSLLVRVPLGVAVFAGSLYAIWRMAGRPDGAEVEVLERVGVYTRKLGWRS